MKITYKITSGSRLGNITLCIYKAFLFAEQNNVDFSNVIFNNRWYQPFFKNIKQHFVSDAVLSKIKFNRQLQNFDVNTQKVAFDSADNIEFSSYIWNYPNTPNEMILFNKLFDNQSIRIAAFTKYKHLFNIPTVGFTVRRGDFMKHLNLYNVLSAEQLKQQISNLINQFRSYIRIIITSDDLNFCKNTLKEYDKNIYYLSDTLDIQIMALSFCDFVINNGAFYRSIDRINKHESTFGQIAQCLGVSRKFLTISNNI